MHANEFACSDSLALYILQATDTIGSVGNDDASYSTGRTVELSSLGQVVRSAVNARLRHLITVALLIS